MDHAFENFKKKLVTTEKKILIMILKILKYFWQNAVKVTH